MVDNKQQWKAWLYLSPAIVLLLVFTAWPIVNTLRMAFLEGYSGLQAMGGRTFEFGLGNFLTVIKYKRFLQCLKNTFILCVATVPISTALALLIAVALNSIKPLQKFLQTIFFLPYVTNSIAIGMVFATMFNIIGLRADGVNADTWGIVNTVIQFFGGEPINWINPGSGYWPNMIVMIVYIVWNALNFDKGVSCDVSALGTNFARFFFNFPMTPGGHLWFVPMLLGLYLAMPLLSPWAEKVTEKELRGWILLWLLTTLFPFVRKLWACWFASGADAVSGTFWSHTFGLGDFEDLPFLWGECPWNSFGTFQYVSGFFGYLLIGLYLRKFLPQLNWRQTLSWAIPLWTVGYAIVAGFFYFRIPFDGTFPLTRPYALAVDLEMSWEFCSLGVALTVIGYVLVLRKLDFSGWFYAHVVRPVSEASYGTYLMHMLILSPVVAQYRLAFPTPLTIILTAFTTFLLASFVSIMLRRIPKAGEYFA